MDIRGYKIRVNVIEGEITSAPGGDGYIISTLLFNE